MGSNNIRINMLCREDVFCYKTIVYCSQERMHKIHKQIFEGHVTEIMPILMCHSCFLSKLRCFYVCFSYFSHF